MNYNRFKSPLIFFLLFSATLIFIWFKQGLIYGGGDVGLQTYNPQRTLENAQYIWWEAVAPGNPIPQGLTAVPFHFIFSKLQLIGFGPVLLQATLFFLILFFMGYGMYRLLLSIFNVNKFYAILGGLFYMINPYMMVQVWHRFVHSTFFLAAALPFLVIFWTNWIKKGNSFSLLLFLFTNLIAVYLYGTLAYLLTVWILLFLITLGEIIIPFTNLKHSSRLLVKFLIGFILWLLTNSWWLVPTFSVGPATFAQQHTGEESLVTLINISKQTIIPYSLQLVNPFYLFLQAELGQVYANGLMRIIPWLSVIFILIGLISGLKQKKIVLYSLIFLIVLLFAKGAASPFTYPYIFGFEHLFSLGILRNPFEKIGILLPFVGSILLIAGIGSLRTFFSRFNRVYYINSAIILSFVALIIFHWPMFISQPFGKPNNPGYVQVPQSYKDTDNWIKNEVNINYKSNIGKILHLPLPLGESVSYKWRWGYNGLESSDLLFSSLPSISHGFNISRLDDSLTALSLSFLNFGISNQNYILRLLQNFNVRFIVLHKDINWLGGDLYDPTLIEEKLNQLNFLKKSASFEDLLVYKVSDDNFKPKINLTVNYQLIYPSNNGTFWPWSLTNDNLMITPSLDDQINNDTIDLANQVIVFPESSFNYPHSVFINNLVDQIASSEALAQSLISEIRKVKPILLQNGEINAEHINDKLISATEKMIVMLKAKRENSEITNSQLDDYKMDMETIFSQDLRNSRLLLYINERDMSLFLQVHFHSLPKLKEGLNPNIQIQVDGISQYLNNQLIRYNLIPQYSLKLDTKEGIDSQKVFKFKIPKKYQYEILMIDIKGSTLYPTFLQKINLSINGQVKELTGQLKENVMSFGYYEFDSGDVEIGYNIISSSNLAQSFDNLIKIGNVTIADGVIKVESIGGIGYIESSIPGARGGDVYRVSFEVMSQNANGFNFQLAQDIDNINEAGKKVPQLNEFINLTPNNWQHLRFTLNPLKLTTQEASIRLIVSSNPQSLTQSAISIRNLKIEKILNNDIVLKAVLNEQNSEDDGGQILDISQKSPVLYHGKVKIIKPSFFIFSETFHPGWKLTLSDGHKNFSPKEHLMANLYGNAYFIDQIGEYDFILEFEPQRLVNRGALIAFTTYVGLIMFIIWRRFRKHES
ncbi:MAG: hypothetical protein Q8P92_02175 [Candidatus Daviesbacteria bacterium]|nr:hypothetical protein [Candidatus Daviesbacteria bacterium]